MTHLFSFLIVLVLYLNAEEWVRTPVGLMHHSCVHKVPSGSTVEFRDGAFYTSSGRLPNCTKSSSMEAPLFKGGWQTYTKQNLPGVKTFLGNFNVPDAPQTYDAQTVFLFTGMQNIDWVPPDPRPKALFDIIQPVLQYGPSAAGGGEFWSVGSWYVPLGRIFDSAVYSELVKVNPGDDIFGNMTRVGDESWFIDTQVNGISTNITVKNARLESEPWIYVTLESYADYDDLECTEWPTLPCRFSNLKIFDDNDAPMIFNWTSITKDSVCDTKSSIEANGDIDIIF